MKLVLFVDSWAERVVVRPDWQQMLFFEGQAPAAKSFVVLESKELRGSSAESVVKWLEAETGRATSSRDVVEIPERLWRRATLDDFIDAHNVETAIWQVPECFSVGELAAFAERWAPSVVEHAGRALAEPEWRARVRLLKKLGERSDRVFGALYRTSARAAKEREELAEKAERALIAELAARPVDLATWISVFGKLESWLAIHDMAQRLGQELAATKYSNDDIAAWLEQLWNDEGARQHLRRVPGFWAALTGRRLFAASVRDESVDITNAVEQKAAAGWELWRGRRVGRIVPGRSVLMIQGKNDRTTIYVRGERRLKHAAERAGGSVRRFGCTLTVGGARDKSVSRALLEVERIETLANVAPESLKERLAELGLPPSHLAYRALARVREDPRQARILADLVIEYTLGIDADVARQLARAQSVGNRRR